MSFRGHAAEPPAEHLDKRTLGIALLRCGISLRAFVLPYIAIRNRKPGYAVSIIKAGAAIVGHPGGPVRPPLTDLTADESEQLAALIAGLGPR